MCGIICRLSITNLNPKKTIHGIKELEYRGYDSYGILLYNHNDKSFILKKDIGELDLNEFSNLDDIKSNIEIGHTRWATHGGVTKNNSHPHFDEKQKFFVVMNGIIENYIKIKTKLNFFGYNFISETDTEVIPHLFSYFYEDLGDVKLSLIQATKKVIEELEGEFSFLVKYENFIIGYKNINPLIIGVNNEEIFISSDSNLVQKNSTIHFILDDDELFLGSIDENEFSFEFYDLEFNQISKKSFKSYANFDFNEKSTNYYMEKEILQQKYLGKFLTPFNLENINYFLKTIKNKKVIITGAGTSFHAAIFLHYTLLKLGILSQLILASELKNYSSIIQKSLVVVFSQSGETADLIYPLKELRENNEIFTITNNQNSTLDRFAKKSIYLNCEKEIAVASTKAFVFQIFFSKVIESVFNNINLDNQVKIYENLFEEILFKNQEILDKICIDFNSSSSFFFIGRNQFYPLALEGALKLKEISYIHAEGFAGGELKHGSLALIQKGVPVVVLGDDVEILSNAIEIKTRGGVLIGINDNDNSIYDYYLEIPSEFKEIFTTILMQILSLKMALFLGYNPDKPRNLAKSVTVK